MPMPNDDLSDMEYEKGTAYLAQKDKVVGTSELSCSARDGGFGFPGYKSRPHFVFNNDQFYLVKVCKKKHSLTTVGAPAIRIDGPQSST